MIWAEMTRACLGTRHRGEKRLWFCSGDRGLELEQEERGDRKVGKGESSQRTMQEFPSVYLIP